ncbi:MAG: sodium:proton antiporter [Ruminococcaceae bacterium]|nr:sodium:proton antiporter [Oscillospiraceae bacterium]
MFILLYALWLILNGRITLEICLFGAALSALIYLFMCKFMDFSIKKDLKLMRNVGYGIAYVVVLLKEIFVSNFKVITIILFKRIPITPAMTEVRVELKTRMAQTILANSITLTPGTITVKVEDDVFTVHCLSAEMIEGIEDSTFVKLLRKMEA